MQSAIEDRAEDRSAAEGEWFAGHGRWFWFVLGSLAAAQLVAFWLLCSHQVRLAEARKAETQVQATVLSDCLEFIPGSTIASCSPRQASPASPLPTVRSDAGPQRAAQHAGAAPAGALSVSYQR